MSADRAEADRLLSSLDGALARIDTLEQERDQARAELAEERERIPYGLLRELEIAQRERDEARAETEKLRGEVEYYRGAGCLLWLALCWDVYRFCKMQHEACDELERVEQECETLRANERTLWASLSKAEEQLAARDARVEALEAALADEHSHRIQLGAMLNATGFGAKPHCTLCGEPVPSLVPPNHRCGPERVHPLLRDIHPPSNSASEPGHEPTPEQAAPTEDHKNDAKPMRAEDLHRPDCTPETCTLRRNVLEPAEVARSRGWGVGTIIVGDEGYGPTRLEITALGDTNLIARPLYADGSKDREGNWTLCCRCWGVPPDPVDYEAAKRVLGIDIEKEMAGPRCTLDEFEERERQAETAPRPHRPPPKKAPRPPRGT